MEIAITIHSCSKGIRYFFGVHYFTVFATKDSKWLNWIIWILIHDRCPFWNPTANILHEWTQQHNSLECKNKEQHRLGRLSKRKTGKVGICNEILVCDYLPLSTQNFMFHLRCLLHHLSQRQSLRPLIFPVRSVSCVSRASKISQACQASEAFQDLEPRCLNPSRCLKNPGWFWQRQMAMSWQGKCELSVGGGLTDRPIPDTIS